MDLSLLETLGTSVIAASMTAFVTLRIAARNIQIDNITKERTKWREHLRDLASQLSHSVEILDRSNIRHIAHQLRLRLNPHQQEDQCIVLAVDRLANCPNDERGGVLDEVMERLALLLKHDWERSKFETRIFRFRRAIPQRSLYAPVLNVIASSTHQRRLPWLTALACMAMMLASGASLFVLSVGLSEPFRNAITLYSDSKPHPSFREWAGFFATALWFGAVWLPFYVIFKTAEKKLVDAAMRAVDS